MLTQIYYSSTGSNNAIQHDIT